MTGDRPTGAELLTAARASLLEQILPAIPDSHRLAGLLVARALAIAEREAVQGREVLRCELDSLCGLFGADVPPDPGDPQEEARLLSLRRRLVEELREGRRADDERVHAHLLADAERRVAISNPKLVGR